MLKAVGEFLGVNNLPVYLIIIAVGVYGYMRIDALKAENDALATEYKVVADKNERLAADLTRFMDSVTRDIKEQRVITQNLQKVDRDNQNRIKELQDTFTTKANGQSRDIDKIARAKPALLERRINDATKKIFDEIEKHSSSGVSSN